MGHSLQQPLNLAPEIGRAGEAGMDIAVARARAGKSTVNTRVVQPAALALCRMSRMKAWSRTM